MILIIIVMTHSTNFLILTDKCNWIHFCDNDDDDFVVSPSCDDKDKSKNNCSRSREHRMKMNEATTGVTNMVGEQVTVRHYEPTKNKILVGMLCQNTPHPLV